MVKCKQFAQEESCPLFKILGINQILRQIAIKKKKKVLTFGHETKLMT